MRTHHALRLALRRTPLPSLQSCRRCRSASRSCLAGKRRSEHRHPNRGGRYPASKNRPTCRALQTAREPTSRASEYAFLVRERRHVVLGPIHDDRLQERKVVADLTDLHRRFPALTHAHLGLRMFQYIFAGLRRVRRIDACSHAVGHPSARQREVVLGGVETDNSADILLFQAQLQQRLRKPCLPDRVKTYLMELL